MLVASVSYDSLEPLLLLRGLSDEGLPGLVPSESISSKNATDL